MFLMIGQTILYNKIPEELGECTRSQNSLGVNFVIGYCIEPCGLTRLGVASVYPEESVTVNNEVMPL